MRGWYVISTRPLHRHGGLRRAAGSQGARVFAVSTLVLEALPPGLALVAALRCQDIVATSPPAVELTPAPALRRAMARVSRRWFVLGAGTATALRRRGARELHQPAAGSDSEALLALPELQSVRGREIGMLTAPGGRGLIAATLRKRGARVREAHVYRRATRTPTPARLAALAALPARTALVLTSQEALAPLWQALDEPARARLRAAPCVVASDRLAAHARELGFACVLRADGARPGDLLRALAAHALATRIR